VVEEERNLAAIVLTGDRRAGEDRSSGMSCISQRFVGRAFRTAGRRIPARIGALGQLSRRTERPGYEGAGFGGGL